MTRWILFLLGFAAIDLSFAAQCGDHEYFEYKFTPIKAGPKKLKEKNDAEGRCGLGENHCEVIVQVAGDDKCKTGHTGTQMKGPGDVNLVTRFTPKMTGWKTHSAYRLSESKKTPFKVQVCDEDSLLRGGNDQILKYEFQDIRPGCKDYEFEEKASTQKHPWFVKFELCCRPIGSEDNGGGSGGGRTGSKWDKGRRHSKGGSDRHRSRHSKDFDKLRNRFEEGSGSNRYNLRSRSRSRSQENKKEKEGWFW